MIKVYTDLFSIQKQVYCGEPDKPDVGHRMKEIEFCIRQLRVL